MRQFRVFVIMSILAAAGIAAERARSASPAAERAVRQIEDESIAAAKRGDVAFFERVLGDDFINITAGGKLQTKRQFLEECRSGDLRVRSLDIDDVQVRTYDDVAVMTGVSTIHGRMRDRTAPIRDQDQAFSGSGRFTRVFQNRDGGWRIVSQQTTSVPETNLD